MQRLSPGVDTDRFYPGCGGEEMRKRLDIPADAPVVVCVARMVKRKGQDTLVRAWPSLLRELPDARLLLVGDGPNRARIERMVRRRGLQDSVIMTGRVPAEDIPKCMDAGDVFAMPCRSRLFGLEAEAFGIVFLEAAACGLPVIGGESGGVAEAVEDLPRSAVVTSSISAALQEALIGNFRSAGDMSDQRSGSNAELSWRLAGKLLERRLA
jgi:phosphatidylinositol alpha-1,6-mannosyltransferase